MKSYKQKLFLSIVLFTLLLSSAYAFITPTAKAAESSVQEKAISILTDVIGINSQDYTIIQNSQVDTYYLNVPQKEADFYFISNQSSIRVSCSYVNNNLRMLYLSGYEGTVSVKKPAADTVGMAKVFLQRYQNYTGAVLYSELASMLDNVDATKNTTKSTENIKLEVLNSDNTILDYVWTYTDDNGIVARSKNVVLSYDQGQLKVFLNNWPLYKVMGIPKISAEEATAKAIEVSKDFSYTVDNGTVTVSGFKINPDSLGQAKLSYLNFKEQDSVRGGDPFVLYPSWYVPLGFDKFYPGYVTGMTATIWADTGEVSSMSPMVIDDISAISAEETVSQTVATQELNNLVGLLFIAMLFSVAGVSIASRKKFKLAIEGKLVSSRFYGALLCVVILFSLMLVATPKANASATIPNSKSRIYAAMHGQITEDQEAAVWACDQIKLAFEASGYSTSNHCGTDGSQTTKTNILNYAQSDEQNYDRVALFHFGHMGVYGYNGGYRDNNNITVGAGEIMQKTTSAKHKFVFIWVCAQATNQTWGTPVAWTQRDGSPGHPCMNENGYTNPDGNGQCYISFDGFSPPIGNSTRTFQEQATLPAKYFIKYFYDEALRHDSLQSNYAVRDALNRASLRFFETTFTSSIFYAGGDGYPAWWPGSDEFDDDHPYRYPRWADVAHMQVYGDGAIWLYQPKITLTANYGLSPTFYLDGTSRSIGDVYLWPKTYSVSVSVPSGYTFDHFSYRGTSYGNNPSNIPLTFSDSIVAYYIQNPAPPSTPSIGGPSPAPPTYVGQSYSFWASSTDPNGDQIRYTFNWGDSTSTTTGWYSSGATAYASHTWTSTGQYTVRVTAEDSTGRTSGQSSPINVNVVNPPSQQPPTTPSVGGPSPPTYVNTNYQFSAASTDPNNDNIRYTFNWGDSTSITTGWYASGATAYASHTWTSTGQFGVTVTAEDTTGRFSSASSPYTVNIQSSPPPTVYLTVLAENQYGAPGYVPLYIDSQYVGTTGYAYAVSSGNHQVYVESPLYEGYYTHTFCAYMYNGVPSYNNPIIISVTSDNTLTAYYLTTP